MKETGVLSGYFYVGSTFPDKGCVLKGENFYYGSGGTEEQMNLPVGGEKQRIMCEEVAVITSVESVEVEEEGEEGDDETTTTTNIVEDVVMSMIVAMSMDDSNDVGSMMLVSSEMSMSMSMMAMGDGGGASMPPGTSSMSIVTSEMSVAASMILDDAKPVDATSMSMSMSMPEDASVSIIQRSEMEIDMSMGGSVPEPSMSIVVRGEMILDMSSPINNIVPSSVDGALSMSMPIEISEMSMTIMSILHSETSMSMPPASP